jgi:AcrR family transcriptional regulator
MSSGDPETRNRILAATWQLMEQQRGQGVRIGDIARAAGVSRQAVYLHFGSRTALLVATARFADSSRRLRERVAPFQAAASAVEALERFVEFWGNYLPEIYGLARALLAAHDTDEAAAAAWNDRMADVREGCQMVIERLAQEGILAPGWTAEEATDIMWAMLSVAGWESLTIERGWTTSQYVSQMQMLLKGAFVRG